VKLFRFITFQIIKDNLSPWKSIYQLKKKKFLNIYKIDLTIKVCTTVYQSQNNLFQNNSYKFLHRKLETILYLIYK